MSEFSSSGRDEGHFPSVYADGLQVGEFSLWEQDTLEERHQDYTDFLERTDISPRTREESERILGHLTFELNWRNQERKENGTVI